MAGSTNSLPNIGSFIPTTNIWDVTEIYDTDINSERFKELLVRLYQNVNSIALNLNIKDTGYYDQQEFLNGQLFFPNPTLNSSTATSPNYRQAYRMLVNFGALPNAGSKTVEHNIPVNQNYTFTRIYGAASNTGATGFIPIPFSSTTLNQNISIVVSNTAITITTGIDYTAYINTYVVLEYLKT